VVNAKEYRPRDPIFTAIETARQSAEAASIPDCTKAQERALVAAEREVPCAKPATQKGVAAQLLFVAETLGSGVMLPDAGPVAGGDDFIILALVNAAQSWPDRS
jgi:hypothetical protein